MGGGGAANATGSSDAPTQAARTIAACAPARAITRDAGFVQCETAAGALGLAALVAVPAAVRTAGFAAPCAFAACAASGIGAGAPRGALALVVGAPISILFAAHGE